MGYIDVTGVTYTLDDGRVLLDNASFKVPTGSKVAIVGANGVGKTTLLRLVAGELAPQQGAISRMGKMVYMPQMVYAQLGPEATVEDMLLTIAPEKIRDLAADIVHYEALLTQSADVKVQLDYATALTAFADAGGYEIEIIWDRCAQAALGLSYDAIKDRPMSTLSGGQQKRLILEYILQGPGDIVLLDEPDNFLDVSGKIWLEQQIRESAKTFLYITHDRELLRNTATHIVTVELGSAGNLVWTHAGGFDNYPQARQDRFARFEEQMKRWEEQHAKLRAQMLMYKQKASYNADMASRYRAAMTRLKKFEEAGRPIEQPREQRIGMRLKGSRTAKRAVVCQQLELTGLTYPWDMEVWYGERLAVLGANGSGKSHFLRLLAGGGTDPDPENMPVNPEFIEPVLHEGTAILGARVRPGWFVQTHEHPEMIGRTLLDILHYGDAHRAGMDREAASQALGRYELSQAAEQKFESLSGGQQARFQILLLELSGANLLLLDEPTDNLDMQSAEALEKSLEQFEGTVIAVTHDRWFSRIFDRFLIYDPTGEVYESSEPVWM